MNKKISIILIIILLIDQVTKSLANIYLIDGITIINNFLKLQYVTNTGAAWSILSGQQFILVLISLILLILLFIYGRTFKNNKRNNIALAMLYSGILGNFIDRLFHGYVVDFIDIKIFNYDFPVFNVADIAIVLGTILLLYAIFRGEDNENKDRK